MKHVVVVGAGVVGLCAADALLRRGYRVTILERDAAPGEGCSYGNGGLIVPSHFEPLAAPGMVMTGLRMLRSKESPFGFTGRPSLALISWMAQFARAGTKGHVERSGPVLRDLNLASRALYEDQYKDVEGAYDRQGELMICLSERTLAGEAHLAERAQSLGLRTRVLNSIELADFEPGARYEAAGAVYFEDDAHLTPALFMPALRNRVIAMGAELRDGAAVRELRVSGSRRCEVILEHEAIAPDEVVLAAGAWTGRLAATAGLHLPIMAGKGYGFTVAQPPVSPRYPAILVDGRVAVTPMRDGLRFVGTMELGPPSPPIPNEARLRGMRSAIASAYPAFRGFDFAGARVWTGLRPCPPDGMPYLGRSRCLKNVVFATGHGMMGMSLGPISGEIVAQVVAGEPTAVPLDLMSPDRYA